MSFLLSFLTGGISGYFKAGVLVVLVCSIFFAGWHMRDNDFTIYKNQVRIAAEKQIAETASIQKQHVLVTKGISDEYDAKLALIRQYYANGVRNNNGSSTVPGISTTSKLSNAAASYNVLAEQCTETTLQLIDLQKWMLEIQGIK
jgi:hypothetical protein